MDLFGDEKAPAPVERGPGRPPGAIGKADALLRAVVAAHGTSPGEALAAFTLGGYRDHVAEGHAPGDYLARRALSLAVRHGLDPADTLKTLAKALKDLAGFTHPSLKSVEVTDDKRVMIVTVATSGEQVTHTADIDLRPADFRDFQARSDGAGQMDPVEVSSDAG